MTRQKKTLLVFSQVFVPDPASVGQHTADVAIELASRGHPVVVYTANRGYEDPSVRYRAREMLSGVEVRRLPLSSFGKNSILSRLVGTMLFAAQCLFVALTTRKLGGILFSTSPPMIGVVAVLARFIRGVPVAYWAMDLNPDQLIALGKLAPSSWVSVLLQGMHSFILRHSSIVFALDRFMAERLTSKMSIGDKIVVIPPWPHEDHIEPVDPDTNPFRLRHSLGGKFVIMYSGNHSPSNPLSTLLQAALHLRHSPNIRFVFVGGGLGKQEVEQLIRTHELSNVLSLPYQRFSDLRYSLSAADVHVVSLGDEMAGIIHPCKVYGSMAAARPILYFGPRPSHVSDLLDRFEIGWHVPHGDVAGAVERIEQLARTRSCELKAAGARAQTALQQYISQAILCARFCDGLESAFGIGCGGTKQLIHSQAEALV